MATLWGPEKQYYPGGPIWREGTSTDLTLPDQPVTQEQWKALIALANSLDTTKYMTQEEIQRREEWKAQQREKDLG